MKSKYGVVSSRPVPCHAAPRGSRVSCGMHLLSPEWAVADDPASVQPAFYLLSHVIADSATTPDCVISC